MTLHNVNITYEDLSTLGVFNYPDDWQNDIKTITLAPEEDAQVVCNPREWRAFVFDGEGSIATVHFIINYTESDGVFQHFVEGDITARVQSQIDRIP